MTYKPVLGWVYKVLSFQYLINICKFHWCTQVTLIKITYIKMAATGHLNCITIDSVPLWKKMVKKVFWKKGPKKRRRKKCLPYSGLVAKFFEMYNFFFFFESWNFHISSKKHFNSRCPKLVNCLIFYQMLQHDVTVEMLQ